MAIDPIDQNLLGCIIREDYTLESDARIMQETGQSVLWRASATSFSGRWAQLQSLGVTGIFLFNRYQKFRKLVPHWQKRGTCVSRGFHQALQHSYLWSLAEFVAVGEPVEIAYEPIYAGSRVYIGKGQLGSSDGSVGSWAGEWLAKYGAAVRGKYGAADLSSDSESWAVEYGKPGRVMPASLMEHMAQHTCAVHRVESNDEIADAIASGFGVARCWDTLFGNRDANGMSKPANKGAHCQAIVGVFLQPSGKLGFVELQSWGPNMPSGPNVLQTAGGPVLLPAGCYGVDARDYLKAQQSRWWEAHAVAVRAGNEWN